MKRIAPILLPVIFIAACAEPEPFSPGYHIPREEIGPRTDILRSLIIPTNGINKQAVDDVYGKAKPVPALSDAYGLQRFDYRLHPGVFLILTCHNDMIEDAVLHHMCQTYSVNLPEMERRILLELIQIKTKYEDKLKTAQWN
jgi:hypothetical protein